MTNKELISIANMELRDQLEAKEQMIKELKADIKRLTEEKSELQSQLDELGCEYEMLKELLKKVLEAENAQLKEELESETLAKNEGVEINAELYDENEVLKKDIQYYKDEISTLVSKILKVSPELKEWLEVNYGEYL